jgi:dipeptidyl aminopeptidase/acylaminoacyl peptidase
MLTKKPPYSLQAVFIGLCLLTISLAMTLAMLPRASAAADFDIADVMSAPFPDNLVAASETDVIAWTSNDQGARNVWVAEGPDWLGRQVTQWPDDDGQAVSVLDLAPDGSWLVIARGSQPNRDGWTAAPAQDREGAKLQHWLLSLTDPDAKPVEIERWGRLSPDDSMIAWVEDGAIHVAEFSGDAPDAEQGRIIATPREGAEALTWSPDGTRIAFVSDRGTHAFIGIANVDGSGFNFPAPHVTRDSEPAWSPDGSQVAFLRRWAPASRLPFEPVIAAPIPWQIVVMNVATGKTTTVFQAEKAHGSHFAGINADRNLWWTRDDRLVFPWEKDGWKRLWSIASSGKDLRLITPGDHVIQHAQLASDGLSIVFDSNRDDIDRKHIWSVSADGTGLELLTPGTGIEWMPRKLPSGAIAFIGSGARMAARPFVMPEGRGSRSTPQGELPGSFPGNKLVVPEQVIFPATDGMQIHGQLFTPPDMQPGERRPALLFLHGGSRRQMLLGFHNRGYYHNAYAMNQWLAASGFIVLAVNYRSGVGYGLEFREAQDYGATGASEVRDVIRAGLWLAARDDVDPDRIGLWGGSYGGYLTAHGLTQAPDLFAAGVDIHGVHDWNVGIGNFVPSYEPENLPEFSELAFASSPLAHIDRWRAPVLLIHGDDDRNVRFSETVTLARELEQRGIHWESLVFPDEVHGFLLHRNWLTAYRATQDFFDRFIGPDH